MNTNAKEKEVKQMANLWSVFAGEIEKITEKFKVIDIEDLGVFDRARDSAFTKHCC